ncbi:hypothetical protein [Flavobacterium sp. A45]|uniref:hypothetical protein n=1 Tax=Flavobacterium sp. A45 TaxID=1945862 RepID=UPI000987D036|nr:hypothetical protein [Flavobacterium sp. A45]OOG63020.1 hypothetical protein B0E44_18065 [Flavobacterium sp. A45]
MSTKKNLYRIAILLVAIGSMAFLYWYGFHKNFDEKCVSQNADAIAMVDVKKTRNHFVFSYLKNPSEWGTTPTKKKTDLSDFGIKTPDYLAFFHIENQPIAQWFVNLKIKNEAAFEKAIINSHFSKTKLNSHFIGYYSNSLGIYIIKFSNQILVSNIAEKQKQIAIKTAEDLFLKNHFLDAKKTEKIIATSNAVTFWIKKNNLLEEDGILNLTLEENEITVGGQLHFKSKFQKEWQFTQNPNTLFALGFDFEMIRNQKFITENSVKISKMIGFDLDSILANNPSKTELLLNEIVEKKDSAISYGYDDDFNPIKKVVIHTSREPSFYFSMKTTNSKKVFNYLKSQNAIDGHNVFVNFPLAHTKAFINNNVINFQANPLKNRVLKSSIPKIGYLQIHFDKLGAKDWRFIIAKNNNLKFIKSFETLTIDLTEENNLGLFEAHLKTKDGKNLMAVMAKIGL